MLFIANNPKLIDNFNNTKHNVKVTRDINKILIDGGEFSISGPKVSYTFTLGKMINNNSNDIILYHQTRMILRYLFHSIEKEIISALNLQYISPLGFNIHRFINLVLNTYVEKNTPKEKSYNVTSIVFTSGSVTSKTYAFVLDANSHPLLNKCNERINFTLNDLNEEKLKTFQPGHTFRETLKTKWSLADGKIIPLSYSYIDGIINCYEFFMSHWKDLMANTIVSKNGEKHNQLQELINEQGSIYIMNIFAKMLSKFILKPGQFKKIDRSKNIGIDELIYKINEKLVEKLKFPREYNSIIINEYEKNYLELFIDKVINVPHNILKVLMITHKEKATNAEILKIKSNNSSLSLVSPGNEYISSYVLNLINKKILGSHYEKYLNHIFGSKQVIPINSKMSFVIHSYNNITENETPLVKSLSLWKLIYDILNNITNNEANKKTIELYLINSMIDLIVKNS